MKSHFLKRETIIKRPIDEVFAFFSNAENLNLLTPQELHFKIISPLPIVMKPGALIDYKLKLNGFSFQWRTEISIWEPPFRFVDSQLKGPYKIWRHEHRFEEINGDTRMLDTIEFLSPGWILEPLINKLFIEKRVKEIFDFREVKLNEIFS